MNPIDVNAQTFIENSGWRLARTMLNIPHQYTVRDLETEDARRKTAMGHAEFEWFAQLTIEEGTRRRWGRYNNAYLTIDDWEYQPAGRRTRSKGGDSIAGLSSEN